MFKQTGKRILPKAVLAAEVILGTGHIQAAGTDAPPDAASNGIGFLSCHQMTSTYPNLLSALYLPLQDLDDTVTNGLCLSSHGRFTIPNATRSRLHNDSTYDKHIRRSCNPAYITRLTKDEKFYVSKHKSTRG